MLEGDDLGVRQTYEVTTRIPTALAEIHRTLDGWVIVESIRRAKLGLVLSLAVRRGKRGPQVGWWEVRCGGVREVQISDLNGGGIRLYPPTHPAAKQFTATTVRLACRPDEDVSRALGKLALAHQAAVDDWIPIDRYVPFAPRIDGHLSIRAPDFLARAYARALRKAGFQVRLSVLKATRLSRTRPRVLHLGNSFVVADSFEARKRLANE